MDYTPYNYHDVYNLILYIYIYIYVYDLYMYNIYVYSIYIYIYIALLSTRSIYTNHNSFWSWDILGDVQAAKHLRIEAEAFGANYC